MAVPKRNARGLQDIRTHSGSVDQKRVPHRAYMRITVLEMEKARREVERASAMQRVKNIDARFREIEAEKEELLRAVREGESGAAADAPGSESRPESGRGERERRFKLKY